MESSRRQDATADLNIGIDDDNTTTAISNEEKRRKIKEAKRLELEKKSTSYRMIRTITNYMDKDVLGGMLGPVKIPLDPILGLLIPGIGDILPKVMSIPFIYVSLVKVRSIPLTLAVMFNILTDLLIGLIPFMLGNVLDYFYRSYQKNFNLIISFVEDDREVIKKVNKKAVWMALGIVVVSYLAWLLTSFVIGLLTGIYEWVANLFS